MSLHEIFDLEKHPETKIKKSKKAEVLKKIINNKAVILSIAIYIFLSIIYTTLSILLTTIKLF
jgi:hypothetical protein